MYIVGQKVITHNNPAYEKGKLYCLTLLLLYISILHILEMRSRKVELESNQSYITVQPNRSCTADYENILFDISSI